MREVPEDDPVERFPTATEACEPQSSATTGGPRCLRLVATVFPFVAEQDPLVGLEGLPHNSWYLSDGLENDPLVQRKPSCHQNQHIIHGSGDSTLSVTTNRRACEKSCNGLHIM